MALGQTSQAISSGNETVSNLSNLDFSTAFKITSDPRFFLPLIGLAFLFIIFYIFWGVVSNARDSNGRKVPNTNAIHTWNFWIVFLMIFFFLIVLLILTIFPIWLNFF